MSKISFKKLAISVSVISMLAAVESYAVSEKFVTALKDGSIVNHLVLTNTKYQYENAVMSAILEHKVDQSKVFVAPAFTASDKNLDKKEYMKTAIEETTNKGKALMPVNTGGHWVSIVLKRDNNKVIAYYNDPAGGKIQNQKELAKLFEDNKVLVVNLGVTQQGNDVACGAFAIENLLQVAEIDLKSVTKKNLQKLFAEVKELGEVNIRAKHEKILGEVQEKNSKLLGKKNKENLSSLIKSNLSLKNNNNQQQNEDKEVASDNEDKEVASDNEDKEVASDNEDEEVASDNEDKEVASDNVGEEVAKAKSNKTRAARGTAGHNDAITHVGKMITDVIDSRIHAISEIEGLASGDDDKRRIHGVWAKALYGRSTQKQHGTVSGYKGRIIGGTVGVDFALTDDLMAGMAYSNLESRFKYKDKLDGDKLNARTNALSIYGQQMLTDKVSLQGSISAAISRVKVERVDEAENRTAFGKYSHKSFGTSALLSYNYDTGKGVAIIPNVGLKYNHHINGAYKETGVPTPKVTDKDTHDTLFGIVGTKIVTSYKVSDQVTLVPSLNLSAEYLFNNKAPKIKSRFADMNSYFDTDVSDHRLDKIRYNVGASLLAKTRNIEVTAGYNLHLRKKYQGHQASIKLNYLF